MPYALTCRATLAAPAAAIWAAWADMSRYPEWDPREAVTRLDGEFITGTTGFSQQVGGRAGSKFHLALVEPMTRWTNQLPLPLGRLEIDHRLTTTGPGTEVEKTYRVYGPLSLAFRLFFHREIERTMPEAFAALQAEAVRLAAVA